jgi:hypothetical protein
LSVGCGFGDLVEVDESVCPERAVYENCSCKPCYCEVEYGGLIYGLVCRKFSFKDCSVTLPPGVVTSPLKSGVPT